MLLQKALIEAGVYYDKEKQKLIVPKGGLKLTHKGKMLPLIVPEDGILMGVLGDHALLTLNDLFSDSWELVKEGKK